MVPTQWNGAIDGVEEALSNLHHLSRKSPVAGRPGMVEIRITS